MRLHVGERLEGGGPAQQPGGYIVTSVLRETPWHFLYVGKKIFYNFDFNAKRVRETDELEWLDVLIRTNRYPILDDPTYIQQRRALTHAEMRIVLSNRQSNLWPEAIDLLEIDNTRDAFTFHDEAARAGEPVAIFTRPHGQALREWQEQILPVSSILSVLAEVLDFLRQAHAEDLLLLGLGPQALLIDASDRVHYVGTELALSRQNALLKDDAMAAWVRLFPAGRFPGGYAAPECFSAKTRPDERSDLFAWGMLAFSLFAGIDLERLAKEQGRPWAVLEESHWAEIDKFLVQLPANTIHAWAEELGIDPAGLAKEWPRRFVSAFRLLLSPEPSRRPRSVAELSGWLVSPPPSPLAGLIALHTDADIAKLLLDCTGVDMSLELTVQMRHGTPPQAPTDGTTVADGPLRPVLHVVGLPMTAEEVYFTAFTRRKQADAAVYSPGVVATLWQPTPANLRQWVEQQAYESSDVASPPARVGMVIGVIDAIHVVDALLACTNPRVRGWALRRLEQHVRSSPRSEYLEAMLWRFLGDTSGEIRQIAAAAWWTSFPQKTDAVLIRLIEGMQRGTLDTPVPIAHFLRQLGVTEDRVGSVVRQVEATLPSECPLCKKTLAPGQRTPHLVSEHGYVLHDGDVQSANTVLGRLWERVISSSDVVAHQELLAIYGKAGKPEAVARDYVADLGRLLLGEANNPQAIPRAVPYAAIAGVQSLVRHCPLFTPIVRLLFASDEVRLRDLGMQTVLPFFEENLRQRPTANEVRRLLKLFVPVKDVVDLQLELCKRLQGRGLDGAMLDPVMTQLREEHTIACVECKAEVQSKDLERHLRQAHQIFQFRGERGSYQEVRAAMVKAVCSPPGDTAAWISLAALAADKYPGEAERYLVVWLYQFIKDAEGETRELAFGALAETIAATESAATMLPLFVGPSKNTSWELLGRRLAFEVTARQEVPIPPKVADLLLPHLDNKELPRRARENAALALLRGFGSNIASATKMLRAYVAQSTKKRGIEKLRRLEQRFGHSEAIDIVEQELDNETRMSCPRCPTELVKREMVGHLWEKHRLHLDGQRVREPWKVIEDWVVDYGLEKDPQVLHACRSLAIRDDPKTGVARLQRLLYRRGLREPELMRELRASVRTRDATLCPHCCVTVAIETEAVVPPLAMGDGELDGFGYHLEVSEVGLFPHMQIETPDAILFKGREKGRWLTRAGGILFFVGPLTAGAYAAFDLATGKAFPVVVVASLGLGVGLVAGGLLYLVWPTPMPAEHRLLAVAWRLLVPEILQEQMGPRDWSFLRGLVEMSNRVPTVKIDADLLLHCCEEVSVSARTEPIARACLASLSRRSIAGMRDAGEKPWDLLLTLADEVFKAKLPPVFLVELLACFHGGERDAWPKSQLNALPILLADRAFAAGVELEDWLNLGRAFAVLDAVLRLNQPMHWIRFQAFWQKRDGKHWQRAGEALTALELANASENYADILKHYPDVLLYAPKPNIVIGTQGVWIEGACITSYPKGASIAVQRGDGRYTLQIGEQRVRMNDDPRGNLEEIRRWVEWYFRDFLPAVPNAAPAMLSCRHRMWQLGARTCPECDKKFVPCPGDLGAAIG